MSTDLSLALFRRNYQWEENPILTGIGTNQSAPLTWVNLPTELLLKILKLIGGKRASMVMLTCRTWSTIYYRQNILDLSWYPQLQDRQLFVLMFQKKPYLNAIHTINLSGCSLLTETGLTLALFSRPKCKIFQLKTPTNFFLFLVFI